MIAWFSKQMRLRRRRRGCGTHHGQGKKVKTVIPDVSPVTSPRACCIHVLQFNGCSIAAHLTKIKSRILQEEPQLVLIVQEDWLDDSFGYKIPDYHWIHSTRTIGRSQDKIRGGGVLILIQKDPYLSFERLHFPENDDLEMTDMAAVRLYHRSPAGLTVIDTVNLYHPPISSSPRDSRPSTFNLQSFMRPLCEGNDQLPYDNRAILFCGDVNAYSKLWDTHTPEDNIGKHIESILLDYGFAIDNDGNATYHARHCRTAPDLTTHRGDIFVENWTRQEPIGKNHHNVLSYDIVIPFSILPSNPLPHTTSSSST